MKPVSVHLVVAARPNFMKIAPLYHALKREAWCEPSIEHTGQHYDANMSENFFRDLRMPQPTFKLEVGSGTHAEQTAGVMVAYEKLVMHERPYWIVVVGDVNSGWSQPRTCMPRSRRCLLRAGQSDDDLRSGTEEPPSASCRHSARGSGSELQEVSSVRIHADLAAG